MANNENLKPFTSTYRPKNPGRKPSKLKKFIKENGVSSSDVSAIIKNVIFNNDEESLKKLLVDKKQPMIIRLLVKAYLSDFKAGNIFNIEKLLDRTFGSATQTVNANITETEPEIEDLSPEDREALLEDLLEKRKQEKDKKESD